MKIYLVEYKDAESGDHGYRLFTNLEQTRASALGYFGEIPTSPLTDPPCGDYFLLGTDFGDYSDYGGSGCILAVHCVSKSAILKVGRFSRAPVPAANPQTPVLQLPDEQFHDAFTIKRSIKIKAGSSTLDVVYDSVRTLGQVTVYERDVPDNVKSLYVAEDDGAFSELYTTPESARAALVHGRFGDYSEYGGSGCIWHAGIKPAECACVYELLIDGDSVGSIEYPRSLL